MRANHRLVEGRRGGALLIALALLALGAALLAGSAEAGRSAVRSVQSHEAALLADAESRVAVAEFMAGWSQASDSLPVGAGLVATIGPRRRGSSGASVVTRLRLHRLSQARFVVAVDCQVGPDNAVLARRRLQLLLERPSQPDSTAPILPPAPIGRWSLADLY